MESVEPGSPSLSASLMRMITGFYPSRAIYLAADLGLADLLAAGPRTAADLAAATGTHTPSLTRVLGLLTSTGVLVQDADGKFGLSPMGELLRTDTPDSVHQIALLFAGPLQHQLWGELEHSVRTGESAFERALGEPVFSYLSKHPEEAIVFDRAMTYFATQIATGVVEAYDFSPFDTVVDVGGGQGMLLRNVLRAYPGVNGILFDRPEVVDGVRAEIAESDLADRCAVVGGSFFEEVPSGGEVYLLKSIIHDWDDEHSAEILGNCRRVMPENGRLLLIDQVVPDRVGLSAEDEMITGSDLNMMVTIGGRERTEGELRTLLANSGFELNKIVPLGGLERGIHGVCSVIECMRAA
ncbi:methyltransferase [Amycolatopsis palatopharyngis]|uniref:methyltransferase n=1 Tax=Amycolatopsis palatopharyngis TaxID=187982 RepID=UPI001B884F9C|nr:methyltransferase [Amycolatopsis palatopharyngis]